MSVHPRSLSVAIFAAAVTIAWMVGGAPFSAIHKSSFRHRVASSTSSQKSCPTDVSRTHHAGLLTLCRTCTRPVSSANRRCSQITSQSDSFAESGVIRWSVVAAEWTCKSNFLISSGSRRIA